MRDQDESLDVLLLSLELIWTKSETSFELEEINALKNELIALDRRFGKWQDSRIPELNPTVVGNVNQSQHEPETPVGYWPGNVDTYYDLYVAGVWNIFRTARLLLVTLIVKLSDTLGDNDDIGHHFNTVNRIVEDMIASVPYHLADNLQIFLSELATGTEITTPGKLVGGLLLMHPLYVGSQVPIVPEMMRGYMQRCLLWIGSNMGLGQATLLAKVRQFRCWLLKLFT
jgi:hypothetical protein